MGNAIQKHRGTEKSYLKTEKALPSGVSNGLSGNAEDAANI
jgi:hypothetical protein